jgi:hypothetical protein
MSLFNNDSDTMRRPRPLALVAALTLLACGDDGSTGGGPAGGGNQGGQSSGPGGNGAGAGPQAGEAPGGSGQGGTAEGGNGQGGSAEGGQGGGTGTSDIAEMCAAACDYISGCLKMNPGDCADECIEDLGDCTAAQLAAVADCNETIADPNCDMFETYSDCLDPITCVSGAP